jgi:hypothetical protein
MLPSIVSIAVTSGNVGVVAGGGERVEGTWMIRSAGDGRCRLLWWRLR